MIDDSSQLVRLAPGESARVWTVAEITTGGVSRTVTTETVLEVLSIEEGAVQLAVSQNASLGGEVKETGVEEVGDGSG